MTLSSLIYLSDLRTFSNPLCTKFYLKDFKKALENENKNLTQVGTSEKELERLCEEGYRRAALYYLKKVYKRVNPLCDKFYILDMEDELQNAGLNIWEQFHTKCATWLLKTGWKYIAFRWMQFALGVSNRHILAV